MLFHATRSLRSPFCFRRPLRLWHPTRPGRSASRSAFVDHCVCAIPRDQVAPLTVLLLSVLFNCVILCNLKQTLFESVRYSMSTEPNKVIYSMVGVSKFYDK